MRRLPPRPGLPLETDERMQGATRVIVADPDQRLRARDIYDAARSAGWFQPVITALRNWSGPGERCMLCSNSEASEIEHFRPKSSFPELAMVWANFLWACAICNRKKGENFPECEPPINPAEEHVWGFYFIDEFGNLTSVWRSDADAPDARAEMTAQLYSLNRDSLQTSRRHRIAELKQLTTSALEDFRRGDIDLTQLRANMISWLKSPHQPDVADYLLNGPGAADEPFASALSAVGALAET